MPRKKLEPKPAVIDARDIKQAFVDDYSKSIAHLSPLLKKASLHGFRTGIESVFAWIRDVKLEEPK